MDSNFRTFWLAPVTRNILGYSLFCEQREKWRVVSRKFQKKILKKRFFYPFDLVNTKTTIPLRVGEERWIYTSTLRVSVYIHHYSPPLWGIVVYYYRWLLAPQPNINQLFSSTFTSDVFLSFCSLLKQGYTYLLEMGSESTNEAQVLLNWKSWLQPNYYCSPSKSESHWQGATLSLAELKHSICGQVNPHSKLLLMLSTSKISLPLIQLCLLYLFYKTLKLVCRQLLHQLLMP